MISVPDTIAHKDLVMHRATRQTGIFALILGLAACSGDSAGPISFVGAFELQTVNGEPLPAVLLEIENDRLEVTGGRITLNADNTFSDRFDVRITEDGVMSVNSETTFGTYETSGSNVDMRYDGGDFARASLSGSTLTQIYDGETYVYRR